jgi:hypothetical protein
MRFIAIGEHHLINERMISEVVYYSQGSSIHVNDADEGMTLSQPLERSELTLRLSTGISHKVQGPAADRVWKVISESVPGR